MEGFVLWGPSFVQVPLTRLLTLDKTLDLAPVPYIQQIVCVCVCTCSVVSDSVNPWTVARQAPLSMGFSRQEH